MSATTWAPEILALILKSAALHGSSPASSQIGTRTPPVRPPPARARGKAHRTDLGFRPVGRPDRQAPRSADIDGQHVERDDPYGVGLEGRALQTGQPAAGIGAALLGVARVGGADPETAGLAGQHIAFSRAPGVDQPARRNGCEDQVARRLLLGPRGELAQGLAVGQVDLRRVRTAEKLVELVLGGELENLAIQRRESGEQITVGADLSRRRLAPDVLRPHGDHRHGEDDEHNSTG